jgi:hypothetical protein
VIGECLAFRQSDLAGAARTTVNGPVYTCRPPAEQHDTAGQVRLACLAATMPTSVAASSEMIEFGGQLSYWPAGGWSWLFLTDGQSVGDRLCVGVNQVGHSGASSASMSMTSFGSPGAQCARTRLHQLRGGVMLTVARCRVSSVTDEPWKQLLPAVLAPLRWRQRHWQTRRRLEIFALP